MAGAATQYGVLLRIPNFQKLFVGGLAAISGSAVVGVCIVWIVFQTTGSAVDVGFVAAAELSGGVVFSLIGGTLVDRYDRRGLMLLADLARAGTLGGLALALLELPFNLAFIVVAAFVASCFNTIFNPAEQSIVPGIVGAGLVADANGLIRSTQSAISLVGASVAGVLIVTVGPVVGVGYDALTFLVSAAMVYSLRVPAEVRKPTRTGAAGSFVSDVREGFRWLRQEVGLLQLTVSAGFFNFFSTIVGVFSVVYVTVELHGSAIVFGVFLAALAGGNGLGALAVGRTRAVRWAGRAWVIGYGIVAGLTAIGLALFPDPIVAVGLVLVNGFASGFAGTAWLSAAQMTVPAEMQGRYFGVDGLGSWAILPIAQVGGGILIASIGVGPTYLVAGLLWTLTGLAFFLLRPLRHWGYVPTPAPAPSSPAPG